MIFDEVYSLYYHTVTEIINKLAHDNCIYESDIIEIATKNGIKHTTDITDPFIYNEWNLASPTKDFSAKGTKIVPSITNEIDIPLSTIQKRWLKAISLDPRFKLFDIEIKGLEDVEPLYSPEDCFVFDKNKNGDDYNNPEYQKAFKFCLNAIREQKPVVLGRVKRNGEKSYIICQPTDLEYSEKDDMFRVRVCGSKYVNIINLSSVFSCEYFQGEFVNQPSEISNKKHQITLIVTNDNDTLKRLMLHFAHFRTSVQQAEDHNQYTVVVEYDEEDISEMVIRVLRFGPYVEVLAPSGFRKQIIDKLKEQYQWKL